LRRKLKELKEDLVGQERTMRRTMQPLREVWIKIGLEKIDTHEGVTVKVLLDSGATGMFMDRKFAEKHGFKMDKLKKPLIVTNVDGSNNSGGNITHEVKCNVYYRGHQERMKFNVCNLGRMEVILGMPWLVEHNLEIYHDSELNPQLSPTFIRLLNNLRDYNTPKSINSTGQVTILCN